MQNTLIAVGAVTLLLVIIHIVLKKRAVERASRLSYADGKHIGRREATQEAEDKYNKILTEEKSQSHDRGYRDAQYQAEKEFDKKKEEIFKEGVKRGISEGRGQPVFITDERITFGEYNIIVAFKSDNTYKAVHTMMITSARRQPRGSSEPVERLFVAIPAARDLPKSETHLLVKDDTGWYFKEAPVPAAMAA